MSTTSDYRTDTEAALAPAVEGGKKPPTGKDGGKKPWRWRWFALIALIILIVGGSAGFLVPYLHTTLSASAATVSVTAKAEVYKPVEAQSIAMNLLKNDAAARLGAGYTLVGETIAAPPTVETIGNNSTVTLKVKAEGVWFYHFSAAQLHSMAQTIAGKTQSETLTLLGKQQGVNKISIATSGGWGTALPITPGNITFNVQAVPGLKATQTSNSR